MLDNQECQSFPQHYFGKKVFYIKLCKGVINPPPPPNGILISSKYTYLTLHYCFLIDILPTKFPEILCSGLTLRGVAPTKKGVTDGRVKYKNTRNLLLQWGIINVKGFCHITSEITELFASVLDSVAPSTCFPSLYFSSSAGKYSFFFFTSVIKLF